MEKRSKKDIKEYLEINHEYETAQELAKNLNMSDANVGILLKKYGLKSLSPWEAKRTERDVIKCPTSDNGLPVSKYNFLVQQAILQEQTLELEQKYTPKEKNKDLPEYITSLVLLME